MLILVHALDSEDVVDLEQIGKETMETVSRIDPAAKLITQKEITISGSKGLELNIQFSLNETKVASKTIYVHKGNTVYEIVRSLTDNTKQDTRDKFDVILSTLQIN
jgi:hypothetical protein